MNENPVVIRAMESDAELDAFGRLSRSIFTAHSPVESAVRQWREYVTRAPDYFPGMVRGAFRGEQLVGGYVLYRRTLRLGSARVPFSGLGTVLTVPEYRRQGIARAMMLDVIALATERRDALVLLDGVPDLYHRYGYANIMDFSEHVINRAAALGMTSDTTGHHANAYSIRAATLADAALLLDLYHRYYDSVPGSFVRTLARQQHWLIDYLPENPPWLAIDSAGHVCGFLTLSFRHPSLGLEVAGDNADALLALAGHHARLLDERSITGSDLRWRVAPMSMTSQRLADHLPVRVETTSRPRSGWMARMIDPDVLVTALLPLWRERWHAALVGLSTGDADSPARAPDLTIDDRRYSLRLGDDARVDSWDISTGNLSVQVELTGSTLLQLVCGYRSAKWAADQPGNFIPIAILPVLSALFPTGGFWIPESDWF